MGSGLAFGVPLSDWSIFGTSDTDSTDHEFALWFFRFGFAATVSTIVSGALAERIDFRAYIIYLVLISGVLFPFCAHWVWGQKGWLRNLGFQDFAGAGTVHVLAGATSLIGAVILGPRTGRFPSATVPSSLPLISSPTCYPREITNQTSFPPLTTATHTNRLSPFASNSRHSGILHENQPVRRLSQFGINIEQDLEKVPHFKDLEKMNHHSTPLVAFGFFCLWVGFLASTGGSSKWVMPVLVHKGTRIPVDKPWEVLDRLHASINPSIEDLSNFEIHSTIDSVGHIIVSTMISAGAGSAFATILDRLHAAATASLPGMKRSRWSFWWSVNGGLAGFVAICGVADCLPYSGVLFVGGVAGCLAMTIDQLMSTYYMVDDPVGVIGVHLGGGIWGLISRGLFSQNGSLFGTGQVKPFLAQVCGTLVIISWAFLCVGITFTLLKRLNILRVSLEEEATGLDYKRGALAYQIDFSWASGATAGAALAGDGDDTEATAVGLPQYPRGNA